MTRGQKWESGALMAAAGAGVLAFALDRYFVALGIMAAIAVCWSLVELARWARRADLRRTVRNQQFRARNRQIATRARETAAVDDVDAFRELMRAAGAAELEGR